MMLRAFTFLAFSLTANAWSTPTISTTTGYGSLLANISSLRPTSSLSLANSEGDGECAVTPQIPAASSMVSEDSSPGLSRKPTTGDVVTFTLLNFKPNNSDSDDEPLVLEPLFDTTGTLQLTLNGGNYLPGLHKLLSTMDPGETIEGATLDAGYGGYNPEAVFKISAAQIGDAIDTSQLKVGTLLRMGNGMECRVTEMNDKEWTLDANHILAGAAYDVDVKLEKVEEGPTNWDYVGEGTDDKYKVATFALGCFWGGELAYQRMPGVVATHIGYTQGQKENPTYEEVCSGTTGHTEAIRVIYDPNIATYRSLVHLGLDRLGDDIYKANQVGNDRGTQYRSGIYFHDESQRKVAEEVLEGRKSGDKEIMTELKEAEVFYMGEEYHQQYLLKGGQSAKKGAGETIRCYG
jgi:peptide-methionine (S)-S-oxide reductase